MEMTRRVSCGIIITGRWGFRTVMEEMQTSFGLYDIGGFAFPTLRLRWMVLRKLSFTSLAVEKTSVGIF
jgi:hypothetical protein